MSDPPSQDENEASGEQLALFNQEGNMGRKPIEERGKGPALSIPAEASRKGHEVRYCGARTHGGGHPCKLTAGWGTSHPGFGSCSFHGGSTASHVLKAQKDAAMEVASRFGAPRSIEPQEALFELLARSAGHVQSLGEQIERLPDDQVVGAIRMYAMWSDQMLKVGKAIYDSGLAGDTKQQMETLGQVLVATIQRLVVDLGHDPADEAVIAAMKKALLAWPGSQEGSA